jgi:hypothetical protein
MPPINNMAVKTCNGAHNDKSILKFGISKRDIKREPIKIIMRITAGIAAEIFMKMFSLFLCNKITVRYIRKGKQGSRYTSNFELTIDRDIIVVRNITMKNFSISLVIFF